MLPCSLQVRKPDYFDISGCNVKPHPGCPKARRGRARCPRSGRLEVRGASQRYSCITWPAGELAPLLCQARFISHLETVPRRALPSRSRSSNFRESSGKGNTARQISCPQHEGRQFRRGLSEQAEQSAVHAGSENAVLPACVPLSPASQSRSPQTSSSPSLGRSWTLPALLRVGRL